MTLTQSEMDTEKVTTEARVYVDHSNEILLDTLKLDNSNHSSNEMGNNTELSWIQVQVDCLDDDNQSVVSELDTPDLENITLAYKKDSDPTAPQQSNVTTNTTTTIHRKETNKKKKKKKSLPKALPENSRLLRPTTASELAGHGKAGGKHKKKKKETTSSADLDASRRRAKERVKEQKRKLKMREQGEKEANQNKSTSRPVRMTAEEGQKRARARVRLRELQVKAVAASKSKSPESALKAAANAMGSKPTAEDDRSVQTCSMDYIMSALSMDAESCRSYILADDASTSSCVSSKRPLTVPKGPKFALEAKYGDKSVRGRRVPFHERDENEDLRSISSFSTISTKRTLTTPQAPKFLLDAKYGERVNPSEDDELSIAESTSSFANSLRSYNKGPTKPTRYHEKRSMAREILKSAERLDKSSEKERVKRKTTSPAAPKLNSSNKRKPAKNVRERDEQQDRKQFRARPMPAFGKPGKSPIPSRRRSKVAPSE